MGETEQVFRELEGETVMYRATAERMKEATVVKQLNDSGEVVLKVKVDDPSDRLHGFTDEEVAAGEAERFSTHGGAPGQWTMVCVEAEIEQEAPPSDVDPEVGVDLASGQDRKSTR